jgi:hypothetical protein
VLVALPPWALRSPIEQPPLRLTCAHTPCWGSKPGGHGDGVGVGDAVDTGSGVGVAGTTPQTPCPVTVLQIRPCSQSLFFWQLAPAGKGGEHVPSYP